MFLLLNLISWRITWRTLNEGLRRERRGLSGGTWTERSRSSHSGGGTVSGPALAPAPPSQPAGRGTPANGQIFSTISDQNIFSYFEPDPQWGELVCVHWWRGGEWGNCVWNYNGILGLTSGMSAGEFQSKQKIEDNISISCRADYTVTVTQTKLPQSQIDFREIINCFSLARTGPGTLFQLVVKIQPSVCHWMAKVISLRVVLEIRAIDRVMLCKAMFQTFSDRTDTSSPPPPPPPTYKFTTEVVSRKNRYRVELLISHETEAEGWQLKLILPGRNTTYLYREKHLERLRNNKSMKTLWYLW